MSVRVYIEGGGNYKHTDTATACRRGFAGLFAGLGLRCAPKTIACGSRSETFNDFRTANRQGKADFIFLLVDAEGPVAAGRTSWAHLKATDNWDRPRGVTDDQAHLMVQCMEAWLLADREALSRFYGQGFRVDALPGREDIEQAPKADLIPALEHASSATSKGAYHKTKHGFALLRLIDVQKLRCGSIHASRFFDTLSRAANRQAVPAEARNLQRRRRR